MSETMKRVVITGAAGALGAAVAQAFKATGAKLALIDRTAELSEYLKTLQAPHFFQGSVDLANPQQAQRAMDSVATRFGGIDVLVNVAGGFRWESIAEAKLETWDLLYSLNLKTAVCACKAALPHLLGGHGHII